MVYNGYNFAIDSRFSFTKHVLLESNRKPCKMFLAQASQLTSKMGELKRGRYK